MKPDAILLAAGKGTRLWPLTTNGQKCMVRICAKPLMEYTIESVLPFANKIIIIVGDHAEPLRKHFAGKPYADRIIFAEQKERKGTGQAVLAAKEHVGEWFFTLNGDNYFAPEAFAALRAEIGKGGEFVLGKAVDDVSHYGAYTVNKGMLQSVQEKPPQKEKGIANVNVIHARKDFFTFCEHLRYSPRGELEITDAQNAWAQTRDVRVAQFDAYWNDIGYYWNYLDVNEWHLENVLPEKREGTIEDGVIIKGKVHALKGSVIKSGTIIEGNVFLGENAVLGPRAYLRGFAVVEQQCHIGQSEVKKSVFLKESNAAHFSYIGDSVVGEDVNFGAGSSVANLRFDDGNVKVQINGTLIDSGRRKLGACVGSHARIGGNAVLNCGVLVGSNARVFPAMFVKRNVEDGGTADV